MHFIVEFAKKKSVIYNSSVLSGKIMINILVFKTKIKNLVHLKWYQLVPSNDKHQSQHESFISKEIPHKGALYLHIK